MRMIVALGVGFFLGIVATFVAILLISEWEERK